MDKIKNPCLREELKCLSEDEKVTLAMRIPEKTIGFDLQSMEFNDIGKNIQELIEKCTNGKFTTNGTNGITEKLIAYPRGNNNGDSFFPTK